MASSFVVVACGAWVGIIVVGVDAVAARRGSFALAAPVVDCAASSRRLNRNGVLGATFSRACFRSFCMLVIAYLRMTQRQRAV